VHNSRLLRHQQLVARRREHTPVKRSILALAQMLACPPFLQAMHLSQSQEAHTDTQPNKHSSSPPMVCHSSQHMDNPVTQTRRRNSNPHMANLRTASLLAMTLLSLDTPNSPHLSPAFKA